MSSGYYDTALELRKNNESTVPTPISKDSSHAIMRLDYIFISHPLLSHLQSYTTVKNNLTDSASDHYPIVVTLR